MLRVIMALAGAGCTSGCALFVLIYLVNPPGRVAQRQHVERGGTGIQLWATKTVSNADCESNARPPAVEAPEALFRRIVQNSTWQRVRPLFRLWGDRNTVLIAGEALRDSERRHERQAAAASICATCC